MAKIRCVQFGVVILIAEEGTDEDQRRFADPGVAYLIADVRKGSADGLAFRRVAL